MPSLELCRKLDKVYTAIRQRIEKQIIRKNTLDLRKLQSYTRNRHYRLQEIWRQVAENNFRSY